MFNVGNKKSGEKITHEDIKKASSPDSSVNDTIGGTKSTIELARKKGLIILIFKP